MSLLQALRYFATEAVASMIGNWRASLLAVVTCALSLYVGAFFFLLSANLSRQTDSWQGSLKLSVYLDSDAAPAAVEHIKAALSQPPWIEETQSVSQAEAQLRFDDAFPQVAEALGEDSRIALPASVEGTIVPSAIDEAAWNEWVLRLRALDGVSSVDDDRNWIREVQRFSSWIRGAGLALSFALLVAAAFTIAAVVRLTAYQYLDEISVLRLVGATEFYVRGPFVMEGLVQGLLGGASAIGGLWLTFALATAEAGSSLWMTVVFDRFLAVSSQVAIVLIGATAGLLGSILSIRREALVESS